MHNLFTQPQSAISQTQASKEYGLSKTDITTALNPVGRLRGIYGSYYVYSRAQLQALSLRKNAIKESKGVRAPLAYHCLNHYPYKY